MDKDNKNLHEPGRIQEIARLRLHEETVDELLNQYVKEAAAEFNLPVSLVSIVLDGAQVFAASHGLQGWLKEANGSPVEWSFCANSVKTKENFIVENSKKNTVVQDNPLVTIDNIQCYAGVPMITSNGYVIGNFCVLGHESRVFTESEINRLKEYAAKAVSQIEARVNK